MSFVHMGQGQGDMHAMLIDMDFLICPELDPALRKLIYDNIC